MKVGVIGAGAVGSACALSMMLRGSCRELVLVDRVRERAAGVATDMRYGRPLLPPVDIRAGDYGELSGAQVVVLTAGVNERSGGATDRNDPRGRLRLLDDNVGVYREIVPRVVDVAPDAVLLVITDPPDPLTDLTRALAGHERVFATGTMIDSLRLRMHVGQELGVDAAEVDANVVGEHGTSSVTLWSSAAVAGVPVTELLALGEEPVEDVQQRIGNEVRTANITIIEGIGASQYGIGIVTARALEAVLQDERSVFPVGSYQPEYGLSLSVPSVIGSSGVVRALPARMSDQEREGLARSAEVLREAARGIDELSG